MSVRASASPSGNTAHDSRGRGVLCLAGRTGSDRLFQITRWLSQDVGCAQRGVPWRAGALCPPAQASGFSVGTAGAAPGWAARLSLLPTTLRLPVRGRHLVPASLHDSPSPSYSCVYRCAHTQRKPDTWQLVFPLLGKKGGKQIFLKVHLTQLYLIRLPPVSTDR